MNNQDKENPRETAQSADVETPVETQINPLSLKRNRRLVIAVLMIALVGIPLGVYWWRSTSRASLAGKPVPKPAMDTATPSTSAMSDKAMLRADDFMLTLPVEKIENAGLKIETVALPQATTAASGGSLRTTGTIESNQYKEVPVMAITGGIVRQMDAALGNRVRQGQKLATIYSKELAEAQSEYFRIQAEIEQRHQQYKRTAELVEIGAASRAELEEATAMYKKEQSNLENARRRLQLFGVTSEQLDKAQSMRDLSPLITVESPAAGVILNRSVNVGEVIMEGKELLRVADLSSVWVIGQIYESDFAKVREGMPVTITAPAYAGKIFKGKIAYIAPQVDPQMRTLQVRVEVANPGEMLKLGMFVDVNFGANGTSASGAKTAVNVPSLAVQTIGAKQFVFLVTDQPGVFAQRTVEAGVGANGVTAIYAGLAGGERIVTDGSFLLRAESLKINPKQITDTPVAQQVNAAEPLPMKATGSVQQNAQPNTETKVQSVNITLTDKGFVPSVITLKVGIPARLIFLRKVEVTCATEIQIPALGITQELPFNEAVAIEFTPTQVGEIKFACSMNMVSGKIIVK
ncbi:MAG: efflux RND transporter periplasmic adaptor subunit [Acidobacteriota bacterium]